jgi:hypothetical protein
MVFHGTIVNLKQSKAILSSKVKKTRLVKDRKIMSTSSGNIYNITMKIRRGSTKGLFKRIVVKLAPTPPECKFIPDYYLLSLSSFLWGLYFSTRNIRIPPSNKIRGGGVQF